MSCIVPELSVRAVIRNAKLVLVVVTLIALATGHVVSTLQAIFLASIACGSSSCIVPKSIGACVASSCVITLATVSDTVSTILSCVVPELSIRAFVRKAQFVLLVVVRFALGAGGVVRAS